MNPEAQQLVDAFVTKLKQSAPESWVRLVYWGSYLADDDGSVNRGTYKHAEIAIVRDGENLTGEYFRLDPQAGFDLQDLEGPLAGEPEADWTVLRVEADRDGAVRADFSHEAPQSFEGSMDNAFWDGVHEYLERNRPALVELAARLEAEGVLDGPQASTQTNQGRFGKLFGRRG